MVFIWYADYFFKMPKTLPLCIYWALTWNKRTWRSAGHKWHFQSWLSKISLSKLMVTCVTELVVANVTLRFAVTHFTFRSGGHRCHFLTLLFTMDCLPAFNVLWWETVIETTERTTPFCTLDEQKSVTEKKIIKKIKYCVYLWHLTTHFW